MTGPLVDPGVLFEPRGKAVKGEAGAGGQAPGVRDLPAPGPSAERAGDAPGLGMQQLLVAARRRLWDNLRSWLPGPGEPSA